MSENVIFVSGARLSFPNLVEPQVRTNEQTGEKKSSWNCELLLSPQHPGVAQFMQIFGALAVAGCKEHANAVMQMIQNDRKSRCYGMGEEKVNQKTFKPYDGYPGQVFISVGSNKRPPQMIQADGVAADPNNTMLYRELARKLYGGCQVNAAIKPWLQQPNPKKGYSWGIRCDLIAIQFAKDDTPFGEAPVDTSGMFGAVAGAVAGAPAGMPGFAGAPAPQMPGLPFPGAVPTAPQFGAPQVPGLPSFLGQ